MTGMLEAEAAARVSSPSPQEDPDPSLGISHATKSRSEEMFELADTNGDGVLTREVKPILNT